jgi:hypothetical protein
VSAIKSIGKKWTAIAEKMCGRTGAAIKAHWESITPAEGGKINPKLLTLSPLYHT